MKVRKLIDSFNDAIDGVIHVLKTQRNMRIHFALAVAVLFFSSFFDLTRLEMLMLLFAISLVIICEMINTAIESSIDIITKKYHPQARIAKNVAAGAVLIAAFKSIVVGYLIFFNRLSQFIPNTFFKIKQSPPYLTFITIIIVSLLIVIIKTLSPKGSHLKGGLISGHSALAFSLFIMISILTGDVLIITLSLLMAILVAHTRVESGIHTIWEVILGGILGVLVALLIFQFIIAKSISR